MRLGPMETLRGNGRSLLNGRNGAESMRLHCKDRVELASEVFQGDDRGQFYQFLIPELPLEALEEPVRNPFSRVGHSLGQFQCQTLS